MSVDAYNIGVWGKDAEVPNRPVPTKSPLAPKALEVVDRRYNVVPNNHSDVLTNAYYYLMSR